MNRWTKVLIVLAVIMLFALPAFAQERYGGRQIAATEHTASLLPAGTWVYGISIYATSANAQLGVYDGATLADTATANMDDEIGEATQYDQAVKPYANPHYFTNGVTVCVDSGTAFVEYGPAP